MSLRTLLMLHAIFVDETVFKRLFRVIPSTTGLRTHSQLRPPAEVDAGPDDLGLERIIPWSILVRTMTHEFYRLECPMPIKPISSLLEPSSDWPELAADAAKVIVVGAGVS